jgi:hypothetical protein
VQGANQAVAAARLSGSNISNITNTSRNDAACISSAVLAMTCSQLGYCMSWLLLAFTWQAAVWFLTLVLARA